MPRSCDHDMDLWDAWRAITCHFRFSWWETSSASQLCPWKLQTKKVYSDVDNRKTKYISDTVYLFGFPTPTYSFLSVFINIPPKVLQLLYNQKIAVSVSTPTISVTVFSPGQNHWVRSILQLDIFGPISLFCNPWA